MTGLWTSEMEFRTPPNTTLYGIKFKILAPEYIFQNEIASILQSHKDLLPDFLSGGELEFNDLDDFVQQIESLLLERLSRTKKE